MQLGTRMSHGKKCMVEVRIGFLGAAVWDASREGEEAKKSCEWWMGIRISRCPYWLNAGTGMEHTWLWVAGSVIFHGVQRIEIISSYPHWYGGLGMAFSLWSSFPKPITQSNQENSTIKMPIERESTKYLVSNPQYAKVIPNKRSLRNYHHRKEAKEMWQMTCYFAWESDIRE